MQEDVGCGWQISTRLARQFTRHRLHQRRCKRRSASHTQHAGPTALPRECDLVGQETGHCSPTAKAGPRVCEHERALPESEPHRTPMHTCTLRGDRFTCPPEHTGTSRWESSFFRQTTDRISPPTSSSQGLRRQRASQVSLNTRGSFGSQSNNGMSRQPHHQGDLASGSDAEFCGKA